MAHSQEPTETFIAREIFALRRMGISVFIYAFHENDAAQSSEPVVYRKGWSWKQVATAAMLCMWKKPLTTLVAFLSLVMYVRRPVYAMKVWYNAIRALPLVEWVDRMRVERIHSHFADVPTDVALFVGRLTGLQVTFSAHARDLFVNPARLQEKCRTAAGVFVCSRYTGELLVALSALSKIHLVRHGLDFNEPMWSSIYEQRMKAKRREGPVRLLTLGRFVPKKGLHIVAEALRILKARGLVFECRMIGGGKEWDNLAVQLAEAGLQDEVKLMPFKSWPALAGEFIECDLLIHHSLIAKDGDRDGIPNAILEALACGVPVVASHFPPVLEVIRHGETGLLSPMGDPTSLAEMIWSATRSIDRLRDIAIKADRQVRRHFDIDRNVRTMLQCWQVQ